MKIQSSSLAKDMQLLWQLLSGLNENGGPGVRNPEKFFKAMPFLSLGYALFVDKQFPYLLIKIHSLISNKSMELAVKVFFKCSRLILNVAKF